MRIALVFGLVGCTLAFRDQSIAVSGTLMCGGKPAQDVRVKLWEKDRGPDPDDLLDQSYTDAEGKFYLSGGTSELTSMDPVFKAYHECDDSLVKIGLPKSYITHGKVPKKTFDMGVLNLEAIFMKERREFFVSKKRSIRARREGGANAEMDDTEILEQEQKEAEEKRKASIPRDSSESDSDETFF